VLVLVWVLNKHNCVVVQDQGGILNYSTACVVICLVVGLSVCVPKHYYWDLWGNYLCVRWVITNPLGIRMFFGCSSDVLGCSRMFSDVLGCSRMFSDVLGCPRMFSDVLGCSRMFSDVLGCSRLFSAVLGCSRMFSDVLGCSRMSSDVLGCSRMFSDVLGCSLILYKASVQRPCTEHLYRVNFVFLSIIVYYCLIVLVL
jgi:hypothetical protein